MKIKIILTAGFVLVTSFFFSGKVLACTSEECALACSTGYKETGTCTGSAAEMSFTGVCCEKKSLSEIGSNKVCAEDKGMVQGRCYTSGGAGIAGCSGIGPGLALGEKGEMGCPSDEICCKTQEYHDATSGKPATATASPSSAALPTPAPIRDPGGLVPCDQNCTLCHIVIGIKNIFDWLMGLLFSVTMLVITISGVFYMVSTGSKGMMDKAKKALTYALTAFVIGMGCWLLINIIMTMVGFQNPTGGNWWEFTCDTTQTRGAVFGPGVGTGSSGGTGNTGGTGCAAVVANINSMSGWTYTQGSSRMSDGYGDCSSTTSRAYTNAGCKDPGQSTSVQYSHASGFSGAESLKAGDALVRPGHVGICLVDGCAQIMGASTASGIHPSSGSSMINDPNIKVIKVSDYCPASSC